MRVYHGLDEVPGDLGPCALAIGNFDGIHLGHRSLLQALLAHCKTTGRRPAVLTFYPHPVEVLTPGKRIERLTTTEEKLVLLETLGIDLVLVEKFDPNLAKLSPDAFFARYVSQGLKASAVFVGFNFRFGRDRSGDTKVLEALCAAAGVKLHVEPAFTSEGVRVSSSAVRQALAVGDLATANRLLGRPYSVRGLVVHGDGRGAGIGFPTANLQLGTHKCLPKNGVYVTEALWQRQVFPSVANLGSRPTVSGEGAPISLEVHLLDFSSGLYDETVDLSFLERIRDEKKFASVAELKEQIARDVGYARQAAWRKA